MTVWSLCPLFNELDLFEVRIREQRAAVDIFVAAEASYTYAGTAKPLHLSTSLVAEPERWEKALDGRELRVIPVCDEPADLQNGQANQATGERTRWLRENHQRRALGRGLEGLEPDDVIMLSDLDEIVRASVINDYAAFGPWRECIVRPHLPMHVGSANLRWAVALGVIARLAPGAALLPSEDMYWNGFPTGMDVEELRQYPYCIEWPVEGPIYSEQPGLDIGRYGWHLSYLGGLEGIRYKLAEAAHPEMTSEHHHATDDWYNAMLSEGCDLFGRPQRKSFWIPDEALPPSLLDDRFAKHRMPKPEAWGSHILGAWGY